jgi:hypothetical protein
MSEQPHADLQQLWQALEAPPPHRPLTEEDAATQASVAWLAAAWQRAEPAAAATLAGSAAAPAPILRLLRPWPWIGLAAAAAALLVLLRGPDSIPPPHDLPRAASDLIAAAPPTIPTPAVEILSTTPERIELRSGSVRLTWLQPQTDPAPQPKRPQ